MGWRFRKSISLGKGLRLNIGKKGLGLSAGIKGLRVGVGSKGAYTSAGIPGTGLYSVNYAGKGSKSSGRTVSSSGSSAKGCLFLILGIVGFVLLVSVPAVGFPLLILGGIIYYFWSKQPKQKAIRKLTKARKFFNQQSYEEAITLLKEATQLDKENYDVIRLLGGALHNLEKYDEAIEHLKNFLATNPTDIDTQIIYANCLYKTKKYKEAIDILQKLPEDFELNLKVIQLLGACFAAQKQFDLAISVFKKAPLLKRNLDDELMELHYNLALIYEESGDKNNALKHFKKVYAENVNYRNVAQKVESLEK
ncbi:MAG: DUF4236 domain-containing protein [Patescibacteria group bacterium]